MEAEQKKDAGIAGAALGTAVVLTGVVGLAAYAAKPDSSAGMNTPEYMAAALKRERILAASTIGVSILTTVLAVMGKKPGIAAGTASVGGVTLLSQTAAEIQLYRARQALAALGTGSGTGTQQAGRLPAGYAGRAEQVRSAARVAR